MNTISIYNVVITSEYKVSLKYCIYYGYLDLYIWQGKTRITFPLFVIISFFLLFFLIRYFRLQWRATKASFPSCQDTFKNHGQPVQ